MCLSACQSACVSVRLLLRFGRLVCWIFCSSVSVCFALLACLFACLIFCLLVAGGLDVVFSFVTSSLVLFVLSRLAKPM